MNQLDELKQKWDKLTEGPKGYVIYIVLGFILAYSANLTLGYALSTDTPVVAVFSNSMVPTFYKGDMVVVYNNHKVNVGDIIVFDIPGKDFPIIHRVKEINGNQIITQGDNNPVQDPWTITTDAIHGKSLFIVPALGWVKVYCSELGIPICVKTIR